MKRIIAVKSNALIKTKVLLPQAYVTVVDVGYPVRPVGFVALINLICTFLFQLIKNFMKNS
jgi:hypothetical protein